MARFVILEHDHPGLHWDLMLEAGDVLHTWRLAQPPAEPNCEIPATALPDHRSLYLDYEGPLSGDRGTVRRWDAGAYDVVVDTSSWCVILLHGTRVRGLFRLEHVTGSDWRFCVVKPQ